jgi:hypothetical protein
MVYFISTSMNQNALSKKKLYTAGTLLWTSQQQIAKDKVIFKFPIA